MLSLGWEFTICIEHVVVDAHLDDQEKLILDPGEFPVDLILCSRFLSVLVVRVLVDFLKHLISIPVNFIAGIVAVIVICVVVRL